MLFYADSYTTGYRTPPLPPTNQRVLMDIFGTVFGIIFSPGRLLRHECGRRTFQATRSVQTETDAYNNVYAFV